jgi:hypothetical protein
MLNIQDIKMRIYQLFNVLFCYELEVALSWALITSIMAVA